MATARPSRGALPARRNDRVRADADLCSALKDRNRLSITGRGVETPSLAVRRRTTGELGTITPELPAR
jgi:hypothetical protein